MPDSTPLSSMFHRRLAMLLGMAVLTGVVLMGQLGRLTIVQGATLRAKAESKLETREWTPPGGAGRGRILDRKGRVLAQDRPSLDVLVDYSIISGEWAVERGVKMARRCNASKWKSLAPEERSALFDEYTALYQAHLDRMWQLVAQAAGVPLSDVEKSKAQIVERVKKKAAYLYSARLGQEIDNRLARGEEISIEVEDEVESQVERPILEQQSPHVLLSNVSDEAAFELMRLAEDKEALEVPGASKPDQVSRLPGLAVVPSADREYPLDSITVEMDLSTLPEPVRGEGKKTITVDGVAYHVIGRMKEQSQKEDNDRRAAHMAADPVFRDWASAVVRASKQEDRGRYFDSDAAGQSGVEASQEDTLRGLRGLKTTQLDTGDVSALPPIRGKDVQLTLDVMLQARIQAAMTPALGLAVAQEWHGHENPTVPVGTPLNGAAVVLEVDTGDILALVSTPSISRKTLAESPKSIFEDPMNEQVDVPWIDRAIARPYPPGSIAKAIILNGAVALGKYNLDTTIDCTGHLFPDKPDMFRCWIYKNPQLHTTHTAALGHTLSAPEALMVSCNIFFFTLGQRLGPEGVTNTYQMFGVGVRPWNLGVGLEYEGDVGNVQRDGSHRALTTQEAILMGIGQGPVAWTPLHAADAYCTLARGGTKMRPHVINDAHEPDTDDLHLDRRAIKAALDGLSLSANDITYGTGAYIVLNGRHVPHWNTPGVVVWGKTGTAAAPTIFVKPTMKDPKTGQERPNPLWDRGMEASAIADATSNPDLKASAGRRVLRAGDHSWFVVLVGTKADNRPRYAIAVMMEYAGSGGKVSGPIVNQIIHALADEGYLS